MTTLRLGRVLAARNESRRRPGATFHIAGPGRQRGASPREWFDRQRSNIGSRLGGIKNRKPMRSRQRLLGGSPWRAKAVSRLAPAAIVLICAVGIALRLVQYSANTALWLDEVALVKGITETGLRDLLAHPLPFDQVAPKGFLLLQKLAVVTLGPSDYVLRLFPFLCSIASLVVFAAVAWRILPALGALVATILFGTSVPLVVFSGVVKQYSTDVFAAVAFAWILVHLLDDTEPNRRWFWAGLTGAVLLWLSHSSVLVVAASAPLLVWKLLRSEGDKRRHLLVVFAMWSISGIAVTAISIANMTQSTRTYMLVYWADGFAPPSAKRALELLWPWPSIRLLFSGGPGARAGMGYPFSPLYPALAGLGYVALWQRSKEVTLALLAPIVLALAAAVAHLYPFSDRLLLFLVPSLLLAVAASIALLFRLAARTSVLVGALLVAAFTLAAVSPLATAPPPYRIEDVKSLLAELRSRRLPGDAMYVYYGAAPVMSVYASAFGFDRDDYLVGGCHRADSRRYLEELDTLRGTSRLWVIVTHSLPLYRERRDILAYLDAIGTRLEDLSIPSHAMGRYPPPAEAFLYDLSLTPPLSEVDSATFELRGTSALDPRNGCVNGPQAMIPSDFQCSGPPGTRCTRRSSEVDSEE